MQSEPLTRDALVQTFHAAAKPRAQHLVGVELERHLLRPDGAPVPYFGEHGVRWLMERVAPNGWKTKLEGDNPIALFKGVASVTLEPGSQWEFSGSPFAEVGPVAAEAAAFVHETERAIGDAPITPVALGYTPFAAIDAIAWVPKGRYVVMRDHLAHTGPLAHHMMKGTCATQASYDFADEADAARKVGAGIRIGPLTTAMFANSPLTEGKPNGYASFRGHIWTQTDPRRTGFPEAAAAFTFERWVDYLLDVPMMFIHNELGWRKANGLSFRDWMSHGFEGTFPDMAAWDLHTTSVFPEVRIKRLIEVRGADCVPHPLAMAFVALFTGLYYDDRALDATLALGARFSEHGTTAGRFAIACKGGLAGSIGGRRVASWAEELVGIAADGLDRRGRGERAWIAPLIAQVATGESPSASVLRAWERDPRPAAMLEALRYRA
jgi:glutamate--cysteine ligase